MNRVFWLLVSLSLNFGFDCTAARCQDCLENLIVRSRLSSKSTQPELSTFNLRAYPFGVQAIELESNTKPLLDSIISNDVLAISAERRRSQIDEDPIAKSIKYPFLYGGIPDSLVWIRNNEVVILPRVLLFAPDVARATVQPNDFIATFYAKRGSNSDPNDLLKNWYEKEIFKDVRSASSAAKVRLKSFNGNQTIEVSKHPTLEDLDIDPDLFPSDTSALDARLVVVVLNRKVNGRIVRCVSPCKGAGSFSPVGQGYTQLLVDKTKVGINTWDSMFSPFRGVSLQDSDTVEITTIENVNLFRPRIQ